VQVKNSLTAVIVILLVAVLSAAGAACLPDNPYQRFQLLPVLYQRLAWIYERIYFDPKPIDLAIVGPSKTLMGVSASEVELRLSALGKSASVANFSLVYQGRNAQWAILNELYKYKSPRILVVQFDAKTADWGHPWFMYFAPAVDVAFPPSMMLHDYLPDLSFLPFRQIELFAASLFPNVFDLRLAFDPARYANARSDFTTPFRGLNSEVVNTELEIPAAELRANHEEFEKHEHVARLPRILAPIVDADDRLYLDKIAGLALAHGTKLFMLYIPDFDSGYLDDKVREYYRKYGMILDYSDLAARSALYMQWAHLNQAGAMIVSDRIAEMAASQL
jgi:hypothetical protein